MKIRGMDKLVADLRKFPSEAKRASAAGQYAAGQEIMLDAKRRAPGEDGDLEDSGYVTKPVHNGSSINVEMGFGGKSEDYVVRQHEDLTLNHPALDGDSCKAGEAKFFSNAIAAKSALAKRIIADFVSGFIATRRIPTMPAKLVPTSPTELSG